MGARKLTVQDPDTIVDDMPEKTPVGRERRKAEYRADRAAERERQRARRAPKPITEDHPYPGHVPPEVMFPQWDWAGHPEGPDIDDPYVAAYCDMQWKAFKKYARRLKEQQA